MILTAAALAAASAAPLNASAADSANVTFSIETIDTNTEAELTVKKSLTVTDTDGDGRLTPEDVLFLAHEKYYPGGAAAGLDCEYTWGVQSCYTCDITDRNGNCVYTSSGPYHTRETVEDGDSISWTPQFIMNGDYYDISLKDTAGSASSGVLSTAPLNVHISCSARFKKDAAAITAEGLRICVDGKDTNVRADKNGNAAITIKEPGSHSITACKPDSSEMLCRCDVLVHEDASYEQSAVKIYTEEGIVLESSVDFCDADADSVFTAYDAIYAALQRSFTVSESELKAGKILGKDCEFTVQVNDYEPKPLSKANQLCAACNDVIVVRPAAQQNTRSYAAAAAETAGTVPAVTDVTAAEVQPAGTTAEAVTETAAVTAAEQTAAGNAQTAAAASKKTGNVQTGDRMPVAALLLAGLTAAGTAVYCSAKRRR